MQWAAGQTALMSKQTSTYQLTMEGEPAVKKPTGRGYIPEEVHEQANKIGSPVLSELLIAARKGITQQVVAGLAKGGGAQSAAILDRHGRNCLQLACLYGHYETALAILQSNTVSINSTNKRGLTALHDASTEGHTKVALLLVSMGANVLARTKDGWTCLMCACSNGQVQLARILLAAGCEANAVTSIGLSALHIAAWKGQARAVDALIQAGCLVTAVSYNGKTALQLAEEENQTECIALLEAATSKQSERAEVRIAALESQLKHTQDQLSTIRSEFEQTLAEEREQSREAVARVSKEKEAELSKAKEKLKRLDDKVAELQVLLKQSMNSPPPTLTVEPSTPTAIAKKSKKKDLSPAAALKESRERSASSGDLTAMDGDRAVKRGGDRKLSMVTETQATPTTEKRGCSEKRSITDLVAESLLNPSSMSAIRQELKADNLTPKIQRKIKNHTNQTTLPSLSNGPNPSSANQTERSPQTRENKRSPKGGSPNTRPRWTNPALKDSAI